MNIKEPTKSCRKGFSLIELLVVVAIIGVLAAVGVVAYNGFISSSKEKACLANEKLFADLVRSNFAKCSLGSSTLTLKKWKTHGGGTYTVSCSTSTSSLAIALGAHSTNILTDIYQPNAAWGYSVYFGSGTPTDNGNVWIYYNTQMVRVKTMCGNKIKTTIIERNL